MWKFYKEEIIGRKRGNKERELESVWETKEMLRLNRGMIEIS